MLKAELRVVGGKHHGKAIPLNKGKFLVGREQDCQLRPNSELVSRHHCVFTVDDYTVRLRDLGSTNGTLVNNERIVGQVMLKMGDRVHIGKLDFTVNIREVSEAQRSDAPPAAPVSALLGTADTAELAGSDTSTEFELPVSQPLVDPAVPGAGADSDTTILLPQNQAAAAQQSEAVPPLGPEGYPQQQPVPYYQPMGYPPPGYPYQQPMMPYPPMGMYPQPMHMPYPMAAPTYPQQQLQPPAPPSQQSSSSAVPVLPVRLPNPEDTGVAPAPPPPPPAAQESGPNGEAKMPEADPGKPSEKAAEIIRQHFNRRPPTKP